MTIYTFEQFQNEFQYRISRQFSWESNWDEMKDWLLNNIGKRNVDWDAVIAPIKFVQQCEDELIVGFKDPEHAVLFSLKF